MIKRKNVKQKGKIRLSRYFQELKNGECVAVVRDQAFNPAFPIRIQGRNGIVVGKRGLAYIIKIKEGGLEKVHIIAPAHLIKIQKK